MVRHRISKISQLFFDGAGTAV